MSITAKMNWKDGPSKQGFNVYELWQDDKKMMTLELNELSHTAKVVCLNSRRIFKIEKEGFLRNKTILKNEYGIKIGDLSNENWLMHEGIIHLNDEKLYYTTNSKELQKMIIYKKTPKLPLIECCVTTNNESENYNFQKHNEAEKYPALLMALSWFLFLPVAKEKNAVMAGL